MHSFLLRLEANGKIMETRMEVMVWRESLGEKEIDNLIFLNKLITFFFVRK